MTSHRAGNMLMSSNDRQLIKTNHIENKENAKSRKVDRYGAEVWVKEAIRMA